MQTEMDGKELYILGAGGHAKVLLDALEGCGFKVDGVVDPVLAGQVDCWKNIPIVGNDDDFLSLNSTYSILVNGIGSLPGNSLRTSLFRRYKSKDYRFLSVVHPSVNLGSGVEIDEGVQIMAGGIIQADTVIGSNSIINTGARVDHDCTIAADVHIAPGAVVSGGVIIGEGAHVGAGAVIIQGVSVGAGAIIGAGTTVIKSVPANHKLIGQTLRSIV